MSVHLGHQAAGEAPLIAGTIHGMRSWSLVVDGGGGGDWLGAVARDVVWPRDAAMRALCVPGGALGHHSAPVADCSCGIYAYHPFHWDIPLLPQPDSDEVFGVVEAWGRVEVHEDGFRAAYARPVALLAWASEEPSYRMRVARAAAAYGAEYVELSDPDEFEDYREGRLRGLAQEAVDDFLLTERELVATPTATGFLTRRGRAIGGSGYLLEDQNEPSPWQTEVATGVRGALMLRVAGSIYRPGALQSEAFDPGRRLRLLPEPTNLHDRNAVSVWDADLRLRLGYVPREHAPEVASKLRAGSLGEVLSFWEWRDLRTGERFGLHMLISTSSRLRVVDSRQQPLTCDDDLPF